MVISIDYDWRDRVIISSYRSLPEQQAWEALSGPERIFVGGHAVHELLALRTGKPSRLPAVDDTRPAESMANIADFLTTILTYAPDIFTFTVPESEQPPIRRSELKIWGEK